ncbi:hypothetical protein ACFCZ6_03795 [Streptomyces hydrogenans]|uniref:hypothetical protein n=1 Tax=Streptomyces hydrogenans TaxID=1873719 RepID=UPI0035D5ECAE
MDPADLLVEARQQAVEELFPADLSLVRGVVSVALEGGAEFDGGDEERAGLADRLEVESSFPERLPCGRLPATARRTTGRRAATDARLASR